MMLETNHDKKVMHQSEKDHFTALTTALPVGVYFADRQGTLTYANDKLIEIVGINKSDVYINWEKFLHPDDRDRVIKAWEKATANCLPFSVEYRLLRGNGEYSWVLSQANPIKDHLGFHGYAGTVTEISELIKAQQDSRENAERFTNAFEYAAIGMALISLEGTWLKVNRSVCDLLGYTKAELMQLTFQQITYPEDLAKDLDYVKQMLEGKIKTYGMEKRYYTKTGEIVWAQLNVSLVRSPVGVPLYFISQIVNITDRKRMQEEISENERRLLLATTSAKLGVWDFFPQSNNLLWNDEMYALYGVKRESFHPSFETWSSCVHPDDAARSVEDFAAAFRGERDFNTEFRVVWPDGTVKHIKATAAVITNSEGVATRFIGINQDVTEDKNAMARLQEAREVAEKATVLKSRFLDIAAHELRTPVTSFNLILQLAQKKLERGMAVEADTLTRLQTQGDRIARLVVDLLDVSRLERGVLKMQLEKTDLSQLIKNCISEFKLRYPKREISYAEKEVAAINIDPVRIYQVVANLVDNACKYTPEDTPIEISIEDLKHSVKINVHDHGPGIPREQQESLFTIFSRGSSELTERAGGLGLGLFICQSIVELHQGKIRVESAKDQGSTFTFELPREGSAP